VGRPVERLAAEIRRRADAAGVPHHNVCEIARALGYRVLRAPDLAHAINDECQLVKTRTSVEFERAMDAVADGLVDPGKFTLRIY